MKITDTLLEQINQYDASNKKANRTKTDFADLLRKTGSQSEANTTSAVSAANELLASSSVGNIIAAGRNSLEGELSQALDLLDDYSQALADPGRELTELEPMVRKLEDQAEKLSQIAEKSSDDPSLKNLADEAAILASVEVAKFKRGDYDI